MTAPAEGTTSNIVTTSTTSPTFTTGTTTNGLTLTLPATQPPPATPAAPASVEPAGDAQDTTKARRSLEESLTGLDEDTRKFVLDTVKNARSEAKNLRERAKSADDVRTELASTIAKALGIESDTPPDPAVLAQQLTDAQSRQRQASVELAVFRAAAASGGEPGALLDSVSFVRSLADVDPNDADAVAAKVRAAVAANPSLGITPQRRVPGPNPAAGASANGEPDLESQIAEATKKGDITLAIHLQNQKLANAPR